MVPPFFVDVMKILTWAVRLALFLFFFLFAVQNTEPVSLRLLLGQTWQLPLVLVLLITFAAGAVLGMLSLLALIFRQRREIASLKRRSVSSTTADTPPMV